MTNQQFQRLLKRGYRVHRLRPCTKQGKSRRPIECLMITKGGSR